MELTVELARMDEGKKTVEGYVKQRDDNYSLLIFNDSNEELLKCAYKYMDRFMKEYDYTYILTSVELNTSMWENKSYSLKRITDEEMSSVVKYVSVICFPKIKIISLTEPWHRYADRLVGFRDIDLDIIVPRCLFEIKGEL